MKLLLLTLALLLWPGAALAAGESGTGMEVACGLCHFCSAPAGFCVLIWAVAALLALLLLVLLTGRSKKCPNCHAKCKRSEWLCPRCNYNFDSGQIYQPPQSRPSPAPATPSAPATAPPAAQAAPAQPAQRTCPHCGRELPERAQFCAGCGQRV